MTWRTGIRVAAATCLALLAAAPAGAQTAGTGTLIVTVVDQSGGVLPQAMVTVTSQDRAAAPAIAPRPASDAGVATFDALPPGRYAVHVEFPGMAPATIEDVRVRAGETRRTVTLLVKGIDEGVTVARDAQSAVLELKGPAFSTFLSREMIESLPDDPDEMAAVLEAMAPPGAKFRVDGFSGGTLPPKYLIKSIRLPKMDEMAAEYHGGLEGFLFIDIKTQAGAGPLRGSVDGTFFDDALSAKNPFTPTKGAEQNRAGNWYLAGTLIPNRTSFSVNVGGKSGYTSPNLFAVLPDGTTRAEALKRPSDTWNFGVRVDNTLAGDHALRLSLDGRTSETTNQGIGGFNLPERAFRSTQRSYTLRLTEGGPVGKRMYIDSRLQLIGASSANTAAVEAPTTVVLDAFSGGGAQVRGGQHAFELEAASSLDYVRGRHSWRAGVLVEGGRYRSDDMSNYLGTYTFSSLAAFNAGTPSVFTRKIGDPSFTYSDWTAGLYVEDDWRVSRGLLVSPGLRVDLQSLTRDHVNLSPRLTIGWAPFGDGTLLVRAAYGYLDDWINGGLYKQASLLDGTRLTDLNITNPSYPDPPVAGPAVLSNRYLWSGGLNLPRSHRLNLGVDRQLSQNMKVNVSYTFGRGVGVLRGRNLNAPDANNVRPDPRFANVIELVPDAGSRVHTVNASWNLTKLNWKRSFFGVNYTWDHSSTNTTGAFSPPANGDALATEWGPSRPSRRVGANMSMQPVADLTLALNASVTSGQPYNVTTGHDDNVDGLFNDRPAGVARNSARGASNWVVGGRVAYAWKFGPARDPAGKVPRYRIDAAMNVTNLLNRTNDVGYVGVMTSPLFGQPTNAAGMRRMTLTVKFGF
jgi:Carboxypeptidase regulatory-like domain